MITAGPATVAAGGTAATDVTITGPDLGSLDFLVAVFTVAPAGGVEFLDPQTADVVGDADDVFAGRSHLGSFFRKVSSGVLTVSTVT